MAGEWLLPLVIGGFREQYPAVTVSLQIGGSPQISQWLKNREVEMGILGMPVKSEDVECRPWVRDPVAVITPPWHPLNGREEAPADLTNESIIVREDGSGNRQALEQQLSNFHISLDQFANIYDLGSPQAVINAVRMGLGIGVVSRWAAGELIEKGVLGEVRVPEMDLSYDLYLAWNRPDSESLASRAFRLFISSEEITGRFKKGMGFFSR